MSRGRAHQVGSRNRALLNHIRVRLVGLVQVVELFKWFLLATDWTRDVQVLVGSIVHWRSSVCNRVEVDAGPIRQTQVVVHSLDSAYLLAPEQFVQVLLVFG